MDGSPQPRSATRIPSPQSYDKPTIKPSRWLFTRQRGGKRLIRAVTVDAPLSRSLVMQRIWCRSAHRTDLRTFCPAKRSAIRRNGGHCVQSDRLVVTVESANVARTSRQLIGGHQEDAIPLRIGHDVSAMLAAFRRGRGLSLTHPASFERRLRNDQRGRHLTFQKPMQTTHD